MKVFEKQSPSEDVFNKAKIEFISLLSVYASISSRKTTIREVMVEFSDYCFNYEMSIVSVNGTYDFQFNYELYDTMKDRNVSKKTKQELEIMDKLVLLFNEMMRAKEPFTDVLGYIYNEINATVATKGQFFTPSTLAEKVASFLDASNGFIGDVSGSGTGNMVFAGLKRSDASENVSVVFNDIDITLLQISIIQMLANARIHNSFVKTMEFYCVDLIRDYNTGNRWILKAKRYNGSTLKSLFELFEISINGEI